MTKFYVAIAVPGEALPNLMSDLSVYGAELVSVSRGEDTEAMMAEDPEAYPAIPKISAKPSETRNAGHQTTALQAYHTARDLYRDTQSSFRSSDIWRALRAEGKFPSKSAVSQHLNTLRVMGVIKAVSGKSSAGGGYDNVIVRDVDDEQFEELYRELAA